MTPRERIAAVLDAIPYAGALGVRGDMGADGFLSRLPFREDLVGNERMQALHGGLIGAFMEITALVSLRLALDEGANPRTIGVTVEYLRPGRPRELFAQAQIKRLGKRIANVHVEAWQDEFRTPVALLQGRFLVGDDLGDD